MSSLNVRLLPFWVSSTRPPTVTWPGWAVPVKVPVNPSIVTGAAVVMSNTEDVPAVWVTMLSGARVPVAGVPAFAPRRVTDLPMVTPSSYVPAATSTVPPAETASMPCWMVANGESAVPELLSLPVAAFT